MSDCTWSFARVGAWSLLFSCAHDTAGHAAHTSASSDQTSLALSISQIATTVLGVVLGMWVLLSPWMIYGSWLHWLSWRYRNSGPRRPAQPLPLPHVTVQLPVFNEENVIARLLNSVGKLDWPAELLQIQLLDDSTDRTPEIAAPIIDRLRATGQTIAHIRRTDRQGYKAGALSSALPSATGEFILILDADFVPESNLLRQLMPWFVDPRIAFAQGRWGHLAPPVSLIERTAGYWIDRHLEIEQVARSRSGQFFNFNGSGGVWRRSAIDDAGGWSADTITEDLDISLRAWQRGWKFIFDFDAVVPAEIPSNAASLRIQQRRWARGAFQVARLAIPQLASEPLRDRITISLQLTGYLAPILFLALALTSGLVAWARLYHPSLGFYAGDLPMLGFFLPIVSQVLRQAHKAGLRRAWLEFEAVALGIALVPLAVKAGYEGLRTFGGVFERTPKSTRAAGQMPGIVFVELTLGLLCIANAVWAMVLGAPWIAPLPILAGAGLLAFAWRTVWP